MELHPFKIHFSATPRQHTLITPDHLTVSIPYRKQQIWWIFSLCVWSFKS